MVLWQKPGTVMVSNGNTMHRSTEWYLNANILMCARKKSQYNCDWPVFWPVSLIFSPQAPGRDSVYSAGSFYCSSRSWHHSPSCPPSEPLPHPDDHTARPVIQKDTSNPLCTNQVQICTLCNINPTRPHLGFVGLYNLHVLLQLSAQLFKSSGSLLKFHVSLLNGLAEILQERFWYIDRH